MSAGAPLFLSSGDAAVDRRLDWARALLEEGNAADAAALLAEATERAPGFLPGWLLLGEARLAGGEEEAAAEAFRRALALDPQDRLGAGARLARLAGGREADTPAASGLSAAYVRTLFDQYAGRFDAALAKLDYSGPERIEAALAQACAALARPFAFARALDLGCGTGLVGARLGQRIGWLAGVDLSPNMVERARARGGYDELAAADMTSWLAARPAGEVDLVFAGDAFCYLADLGPVLVESARVLEPAGLLAFTVETHDGEGVLLRETLRYAHAEPYMRAALEAAGLSLLSCTHASTRTEKGEPVPGLVLVAQRAG
ncbi:class I SAM-dependent DNA methyltransferase [Ancylobacter lacus]|uniref:class I SAM-dependent DNA methyltransferase n=1 Tax=Ancylobacter lacus TaxID=2579970 RepID=UPI001BD196A7|nr:methyltransferase domain-containing protein [Ancylobacter lacus]MBS7538523.1 methyltransferase domain-containing protein [Ancylobacter lacus]